MECYGVYEGYAGMIRGEMELMRTRDVSGIIQQGGTILRTARSMEFKNGKRPSRSDSSIERTWHRRADRDRWRWFFDRCTKIGGTRYPCGWFAG